MGSDIYIVDISPGDRFMSMRVSSGSWPRRALDPAARKPHFWRDRSGREVDFVLEKDGMLVALEIKASSQVSPADADGIAAFRQGPGRGRRLQCGAVLHGGAARPLGQGLWALPWGWLMPVAEGAGAGIRRLTCLRPAPSLPA